MRDVAVRREQTATVPWHTNGVVWLMPFAAAHAIGHFWNDAGGGFLGYYVNLQAPEKRRARSSIRAISARLESSSWTNACPCVQAAVRMLQAAGTMAITLGKARSTVRWPRPRDTGADGSPAVPQQLVG
jgi:hypothetical protein